MTEQTMALVTSSHLMPALTMALARERYGNLVTFVKDLMVDGIDYGTIPGTNKPTLYKPGAERLCTFFGLTPTFSIIEKEEDWDGLAHGGEPFFYYWFRCHIRRGDYLLAEADGSCNSRESKYRWRWVGDDELPPGVNKDMLKKRGGSTSEFDFAVEKAETGGKYGKPAEYWHAFKDAIEKGAARKVKRTTKAGKEMDAWEIDTTVYRIPNDDIASQVNTVQKMAQKRALVAAVLIAANASEFFTQDLEDLDGSVVEAHYTVIRETPAPTAPPIPAPPANELDAALGRTPAANPAKGTARKVASVKVTDWGVKGAEFAQQVPYYMAGDKVDWFHITGAAAKCGYAEINDGNLDEVLRDLRQYAADQQAVAADDKQPDVSPVGDIAPF